MRYDVPPPSASGPTAGAYRRGMSLSRALAVSYAMVGLTGLVLGVGIGLWWTSRRDQDRTTVITITRDDTSGWMWEVSTGYQMVPTVSGPARDWHGARALARSAANELALRGPGWAEQHGAHHSE